MHIQNLDTFLSSFDDQTNWESWFYARSLFGPEVRIRQIKKNVSLFSCTVLTICLFLKGHWNEILYDLFLLRTIYKNIGEKMLYGKICFIGVFYLIVNFFTRIVNIFSRATNIFARAINIFSRHQHFCSRHQHFCSRHRQFDFSIPLVETLLGKSPTLSIPLRMWIRILIKKILGELCWILITVMDYLFRPEIHYN